MAQNIPIAEDWMIENWSSYYSFTTQTDSSNIGMAPSLPGYPQSLATQNHVDLRTFIGPESWTATSNGSPYAWTGTYGFQSASFNAWPGVTINLPTSSPFTFTSQVGTADLSQLNPASSITLALPNFPLTHITTSTSFLDISSDGFSTHTDSLSLSSSTTTLTAGNSTGTWPLSALVHCDTTAITGVRLRLVVTSPCALVMMALRVIDPLWTQTNVDFDNRNGWLRQCIPLNGDIATVPVANPSVIAPLWRAAAQRNDDPRPIDSDIGVVFNTGSQTQQNSFTIYMREISQPGITQAQLNQSTQAELTARPQPQYGPDDGVPRAVNFRLAWGALPQVQVTNYDKPGGGYQWSNVSFANNATYLAVCSLRNTTARLTIYLLNQITYAIRSVLFDTGPIADSYLFMRRAGRIGFQCNLNDGDTYLRSIQPQALTFAEYVSAPLNSITPVSGASLFVNATADSELWTGWSLLPSSADTILQGDPIRQLSGLSSQVAVLDPTVSGQGITSNYLTPPGDSVSGIINMTHVAIRFALWFPSAALTAQATVEATLLSIDGASISLTMPAITPDQWQPIELTLPSTAMQSGLYALVLTYVCNGAAIAATFWVDQVSVTERALGWAARSVVSNPWRSNYAPWTDFGELINSHADGISFPVRGTALQVRGQAYRQDAAVISAPKIIPQYAQLGRLVWPENASPSNFNKTAPTGAITTAHVGPAYTLTATSVVSTNGVISYQWYFGDGAVGNGVSVLHTFPSGTWTITLMLTDAIGLVTTVQTAISI